MSKHWQYEVWIPASHEVTEGHLRHVLQLAEAQGYVPRRIHRMLPSYEMVEHPVDRVDMAVGLLYPAGGLLSFGRPAAEEWDTPIRLSIPSAAYHVSHRPSGLAQVVPSTADSSSYREIVLYVDDYVFRDGGAESKERIEHATSVHRLYCDLCTYLDASYGAAWSNYDYEEIIRGLHVALYGHLELSYDETPDSRTFQALMNGERLRNEVKRGKPPSTLFWMQYLPHEYAEHVDLVACVTLGGKLLHLPKGILLTFFDHPWQVNYRALLLVNEQWRNLHPDTLLA